MSWVNQIPASDQFAEIIEVRGGDGQPPYPVSIISFLRPPRQGNETHVRSALRMDESRWCTLVRTRSWFSSGWRGGGGLGLGWIQCWLWLLLMYGQNTVSIMNCCYHFPQMHLYTVKPHYYIVWRDQRHHQQFNNSTALSFHTAINFCLLASPRAHTALPTIDELVHPRH